VDIRYKQKKLDLLKYIKNETLILALTPYSSYLVEFISKEYITYNNIISKEIFQDKVLQKYRDIQNIFEFYKDYTFLIRDIAFLQTFEIYLKYLFDFLDTKKSEGYIIKYITDAEFATNMKINDNSYSYIYTYNKLDKIIFINKKDNIFYKTSIYKYILHMFFNKKDLIKSIYNKYTKKDLNFYYDNKNFFEMYKNIDSISIENNISKTDISKLIYMLEEKILHHNQFKSIQNQYKIILKNMITLLLNDSSNIKISPFTFVSKYKDYKDIILYKANKIPIIFMQHGSYLHENIFLKYSEIYPADINFVFNDYTKKLFEKRGAKKVYSVGSINFNYPISERKKEYDFIYITYCTSYSYTGVHIGLYMKNKINLLSVDGKNIFDRHKRVIELFGKNFKNKKICIKIQPGIFMEKILYIPFLELSKQYKNITIEFTISIEKLIEKSKYIISDYFSSEFINRELHYKRDIILFQGKPTPLPEETIEDMKKMFILVDDINELQEKIANIEDISKNRKRYDDIIEFYSSKNCDTKKVVNAILKKELNARR